MWQLYEPIHDVTYFTPEASCKPLAAAFPRAEYRTLPGIGHAPHVEAPELINLLIAGFVPR